jgi:hypothetical protein
VTSALLPREREATGRGVRHKPDTWPSIQTGRQLAIQNTGRVPHVCWAVNNCSRDNGSACFSPRAHNPSGRASFEADAWRQAAFLAAIQAETSSASLMASRNTLAEIIHPALPCAKRAMSGYGATPKCAKVENDPYETCGVGWAKSKVDALFWA